MTGGEIAPFGKHGGHIDLQCPSPSCGASHLRHGGVVVYQPYEKDEDARRMLITCVHPGSGDPGESRLPPTLYAALHDTEDWNNPGDRQGLSILFHCAACDTYSELCILQQKGAARLMWRELTGDFGVGHPGEHERLRRQQARENRVQGRVSRSGGAGGSDK
jgi:hypothetical protein